MWEEKVSFWFFTTTAGPSIRLLNVEIVASFSTRYSFCYWINKMLTLPRGKAIWMLSKNVTYGWRWMGLLCRRGSDYWSNTHLRFFFSYFRKRNHISNHILDNDCCKNNWIEIAKILAILTDCFSRCYRRYRRYLISQCKD